MARDVTEEVSRLEAGVAVQDGAFADEVEVVVHEPVHDFRPPIIDDM